MLDKDDYIVSKGRAEEDWGCVRYDLAPKGEEALSRVTVVGGKHVFEN